MPCTENASPMLELRAGSGRARLRLRALRMGGDVCLLLDGGDAPHIGAVALAARQDTPVALAPRRDAPVELGLRQDAPHIGAVALAPRQDAPAVLALPGHREDQLARQLARRVSQELHVAATVLCGIHIDHITQEELAQVLRTAEQLVRTALPLLAALPQDLSPVKEGSHKEPPHAEHALSGRTGRIPALRAHGRRFCLVSRRPTP